MTVVIRLSASPPYGTCMDVKPPAFVVALLLACGPGAAPEPEQAPVTSPEAGVSAAPLTVPWPVETSEVERGAISAVLSVAGSINARRSTPIGPAVPGRILHIFVQVGDETPFGAPLFQIDPGPYAIAMQDAEAGLAVARAQLTEARQEAKRTRQLSRQNMISSQEHDRAVTRTVVSEAQVEQAEARVARAELDLRRTLVLAPYAGRIVEREVHVGTMATVTPNTHVVVLQESDVLEAVLDVPEGARVIVRTGDPVRLFIEGQAEPILTRVSATSGRIDPGSRTYQVRAHVDNPSHDIRSGAFVRAEIEPAPREGAVLVERAAVLEREGHAYVFRVAEGVAERVPVRIGIVGDSRVSILSGVDPGDRVVVGPAVARLSDGDRIAPKPVVRPSPETAPTGSGAL